MVKMGRGLGLVGLGLLAASGACSSGPSSDGGSGATQPTSPQAAKAATAPIEPQSAQALSVLSTIRQHIAMPAEPGKGGVMAKTPTLPPSTLEAIERHPSGFVPRFTEEQLRPFKQLDGAVRTTGKLAEVRLPLKASDAFTVRDEQSGMAVEVALDGANKVEGQAADGYVVYPGAGPRGADVIHRPQEQGTEDYLYFAVRPPEERLTYRVSLQGVAGLRLVDHTLELLDSAGTPRLRMDKPVAVDIRGEKVEGQVTLRGCEADTNPVGPWGRAVTPPGAGQCEVDITWHAEVDRYPILVDPPWTTVGALGGSIGPEAAVLLNTNKVLVFSNKTARLYDPGTKTFGATGALPSSQGLGVKLADGTVLAAGGTGASTATTACVYNPAAGTWTATGSLTTARAAYYAGLALLGDGTALIGSGNTTERFTVGSPGSWQAGPALGTSTVYSWKAISHSSNVLFVSTSTSNQAYSCTTATCTAKPGGPEANDLLSLADGSVFVLAGTVGIPYVYNGSWVAKAAYLNGATFLDLGALLGNGRVLGTRQSGLDEAQRFDPAANTWKAVLPPTNPASNLVSLADGTALAIPSSSVSSSAVYADGDYVGGVCTSTADCPTGTCVDGYCCSTTCTQFCYSCDKADTGLAAGTCGPIQAGKVSAECPDEAATCGKNGKCNGAGACQNYSVGNTCKAAYCTDTAQIGVSTCQGSGTLTCTEPAPINCNVGYDCGNTTTCKTTCSGSTNTNCSPGYHCNGSACVVADPNGTVCQDGQDCLSGNCRDSVCCDTACPGTKYSCLNSKTGLPQGTCGPIKNGYPCSSGDTCGSGFCSDGVCCNAACTATNDACVQAQTGQPDGTCAPRQNGLACTTSAECGSGFCVDGFCCNSVCNTLCMSCKGADTGAANGTCAPVQTGLDPANECGTAGSGVCALTGVCDGTGSCKNQQGQTCAPAQCISYLYTPPSTCTSAGQCQTGSQVPCPGDYICASSTTCRTSCTDDAHCTGGKKCIGGTCGAGKGNGASCGQNSECTSNYCVSGICCNSACNTGCVSCKASETAGVDGTCSPVKPDTDPRNDCAASGDPLCGLSGLCDGQGACKGNAASGTNCGTATCAGLSVVSKECNGSGVCNSVTQPACTGGYTCSNGVCLTSCANDTQCASGHYCQGSTCTLKSDNGVACTGAVQCKSGNCVDGFCCDSACTGGCQSCAGVNTQSGINGKCDHAKDGSDPKNACVKDGANACGADGLCGPDGQCRAVAPSGTACGSTVCVGSNQVSGTLCDGAGTCAPAGVPSTCSGGYVCSAGSCLAQCATGADCIQGYFCNNQACTPLLANGANCTAGSQCNSTFCVDGFCCDSTCTGECRACAGALTENGVNGVCANVKTGTDPDGNCAKDASNICGADGQCGSDGQCRTAAVAGTICGGAACADATSSGSQTCNGLGTCVVSDKVACDAGYRCTNGVCLTACAAHADCATGYFCSPQGLCTPGQDNGAGCNETIECKSGNCVDGVCCESACTGACQSCLGVNTGVANGKCSSVLDGTDPDNDCPVDANNPCGADGTCAAGGQCRAFKPSGATCGNTLCTGPTTSSGQLCDGAGKCTAQGSTACPTGYACTGNACNSLCSDDSACAAGYFCLVNACVPQQDNSTTCNKNSQCTSGFCVDGYCCNQKCDGPCQACSSDISQGSNGVCSPVKPDTDPRNACAPDAGNPCGADGFCDASGQCRAFADTTKQCGATTCSNATVTGKLCNGAGLCTDAAGQPCPGGYACDGNACAVVCSTQAQCKFGYYCKAGSCELAKGQGEKCSSASECDSNFCVDGVCCENDCQGNCRSCSGNSNTVGQDGVCADVKEGLDPRGVCPSGDTACGAPGVCGKNGECAKFADTTTPCKPDSCEAGSIITPRCDGFGTCKDISQSCAPYSCDAAKVICYSTCALASECAAGASCDQASHECAFVGATCADAFTVQTADGKQVSCSPYRCEAGNCAEICTKPTECASGFDCVDTKCVLPGGQGGAGGAAGSTGTGGSAQGGEGGTASGGGAGGSGQGGTAQGGTAQGGTAQGGTAQGGTAQGGTAQGGTAQGGTAQGGSSAGGSSAGGSAQGGAASGGKAQGGSASGGKAGAVGNGEGGAVAVGTAGAQAAAGGTSLPTGGTSATGTGASQPAAEPPAEEGGCGCRTAGAPTSPASPAGAVALCAAALVVARRRRRAA